MNHRHSTVATAASAVLCAWLVVACSGGSPDPSQGAEENQTTTPASPAPSTPSTPSTPSGPALPTPPAESGACKLQNATSQNVAVKFAAGKPAAGKGGTLEGTYIVGDAIVYLPTGALPRSSTGTINGWGVFKGGNYNLSLNVDLNVGTLIGNQPVKQDIVGQGTFKTEAEKVIIETSCEGAQKPDLDVSFSDEGASTTLIVEAVQNGQTVFIELKAKKIERAMVDLATKMLLDDKRRFAITIAGVAFAVALVLIQVGIFRGLLDNASVTIDHTDADLWVTSRATPNVDFGHAFPESRVHRVRTAPGVERADNLIVAFMTIALPSGAEESALVYALPDFRRWGLPWTVDVGEVADLRRGSFFMLDESADRRYGAFTVGESREVLGKRFRIVGRTREAKSFTTTPVAFLDYANAQALSPLLRENTTYILVKVAPGADVLAVRAELARRLPYNDVHTKAEWSARSRRYWLENTGLGFSMYLTVFLGCLVGIVIVGQTLFASTMEHLREFGTVKAIGGSNWDIYRIIGKQALIAAVIGFAAGLVPSLGAKPVCARAGLDLALSWSFVALVFVATLAMCLVAAVVSFRKIATLDPSLVFRG